jgi:hypothetical protein
VWFSFYSTASCGRIAHPQLALSAIQLRLVDQVLPTDLALLYVVHHAVAAGETKLQLPRDYGQISRMLSSAVLTG